MIWLFGALALCGGILNSVQSGANAAINKALDAPVLSALLASGANFAAFLVLIPFAGMQMPDAGAFARVPWWAWLAITIGALNTLNAALFANRLGSAVFIGLVVSASIVSSVALDHFGLIGFRQHSAGIGRIAGCLLMLGGLALVTAF